MGGKGGGDGDPGTWRMIRRLQASGLQGLSSGNIKMLIAIDEDDEAEDTNDSAQRTKAGPP
jgi:hypothetical protein